MSQQPSSGNSATSRLFRLLERLVSVNADQTLALAVAAAFDNGRKDRGVAFRYLGEIFRLIDEAKAEVAEHPELRQQLYLAPVNQIETLLTSIQTGSSLKQIIDQLRQAVANLAFAADQMDRLSGEQMIPPSELKEIRERAERLLSEVLSSDLPIELKTILRERLEEIRKAVVDYELLGADSLRKAVDAGVSLVVRTHGRAETQVSKREFGEYLKLVVRIDQVVSVARKWVEIAAPILNKFFPGISPDPPAT